jgi:dTDP-4-dehydrorhamnose reductase
MSTVVTDTTTENFFKDKVNYAKRPLNSRFDLTKAESMGFKILDWKESLRAFLQ